MVTTLFTEPGSNGPRQRPVAELLGVLGGRVGGHGIDLAVLGPQHDGVAALGALLGDRVLQQLLGRVLQVRVQRQLDAGAVLGRVVSSRADPGTTRPSESTSSVREPSTPASRASNRFSTPDRPWVSHPRPADDRLGHPVLRVLPQVLPLGDHRVERRGLLVRGQVERSRDENVPDLGEDRVALRRGQPADQVDVRAGALHLLHQRRRGQTLAHFGAGSTPSTTPATAVRWASERNSAGRTASARPSTEKASTVPLRSVIGPRWAYRVTSLVRCSSPLAAYAAASTRLDQHQLHPAIASRAIISTRAVRPRRIWLARLRRDARCRRPRTEAGRRSARPPDPVPAGAGAAAGRHAGGPAGAVDVGRVARVRPALERPVRGGGAAARRPGRCAGASRLRCGRPSTRRAAPGRRRRSAAGAGVARPAAAAVGRSGVGGRGSPASSRGRCARRLVGGLACVGSAVGGRLWSGRPGVWASRCAAWSGQPWSAAAPRGRRASGRRRQAWSAAAAADAAAASAAACAAARLRRPPGRDRAPAVPRRHRRRPAASASPMSVDDPSVDGDDRGVAGRPHAQLCGPPGRSAAWSRRRPPLFSASTCSCRSPMAALVVRRPAARARRTRC